MNKLDARETLIDSVDDVLFSKSEVFYTTEVNGFSLTIRECIVVRVARRMQQPN
jgi:hypothetical protein